MKYHVGPTADAYSVGDKVWVAKYGSYYAAVVEKVGRVRVTVSFTTKGGKRKVYTVPGYDVPYVLRARDGDFVPADRLLARR